jgi:hypothetical protein
MSGLNVGKFLSLISLSNTPFIIIPNLNIKKDVTMEFIPYKAHECFDYLYYQIPMELFFNQNYKNKFHFFRQFLMYQ